METTFDIYRVDRHTYAYPYRPVTTVGYAYTFATIEQLTAYGLGLGRTNIQTPTEKNGTYIVTKVDIKDYDLDEFARVALEKHYSATQQDLYWLDNLVPYIYHAAHAMLAGPKVVDTVNKTITFSSTDDTGAYDPSTSRATTLLKHIPFHGDIALDYHGHTSIKVKLDVT